MLSVRAPGVDALVWVLACPLLLALAGLARGWTCAVALWLCAMALGAAWGAYRINGWSGAAIPAALNLRWDEQREPVLLEVEGELLGTPSPRPASTGALSAFAAHQPSWVVQVRVHRLYQGEVASLADDLVRLTGPGEPPAELRLGQRVRVLGLYSLLPPPKNPGGFDWRRFEAQRARAGSLWVSEGSLVRIVRDAPEGLGGLARTWADWLRARASRALPDEGSGAALVRSLLLGERSPEIGEARQAFQRLGLAHVLAISGFHLTVLAGAVLGLLRLTGDRGALEPLLASSAVVLYAIVVPAEAPIIRSALMVLGIALGRALGRRYDDLNSLAWIAVALLIWRPADLYSLGFQLSFGLTGCLIWLVPRVLARHAPIKGIRRRRTPVRRLARRMRQALVATAICWLVSLPAIINAIGAFSPVTVLASFIVAPLALLVMWCGFGVLLLGMTLPGAAAPARPALAFLGELLSSTVLWLDDLPGTLLHVPAVSWLWALGATAAIVFALARGGRCGVLVGAAGILWLIIEVVIARPHVPRDTLRVDALSLSGGSCTLLRSGDQAILWDCGGGWPGAGEREIPRAVRALGAGRVRTMILSDPGYDHINASLDVLAPLGVRRVILSRSIADLARADPAGLHGALVKELRARGVEVDDRASELALGDWRLALARRDASDPASAIRQERLHGLVTGPAGAVLLAADPDEARRHFDTDDIDLVVRTAAEGVRASDGLGSWGVIDTFGVGPLSAGPVHLATPEAGAASAWIAPAGRRWKVFGPGVGPQDR